MMKKKIQQLKYRDLVADDIPESLLVDVLEDPCTLAEDRERIRERLEGKEKTKRDG
jgi:hypothetical protein